MASRKYVVLGAALAGRLGVEVGDSVSLDPDERKDKVDGRLRLGLIKPKTKGKKSKKAETAEAPVEIE